MSDLLFVTEELEEQKKEKRKRFVLSFFVPPTLTVFYLIDLCDKEQKKEVKAGRKIASFPDRLKIPPREEKKRPGNEASRKSFSM